MNNNKKPWNAKRYRQKSGGYEFLLSGTKIRTIRFGMSAVEIGLDDEFSTLISLRMNFTLTQNATGQHSNIKDTVSASPLLQLIGSEIESIVADKSGFLHMKSKDGMEIQAPNEASEFRFEAWEISDGHGFLAVCAIGGTVSIWEPHSAQLQILRN